MSLWDKFVRAVNPQIEQKAEQILAELKEACPRSAEGHNGRHVADSFRIMGKGESGAVSGTFRAGLLTKVTIGSDELGAYYAAYGNGGRGRIIYPTHAKALHLKDGSYRSAVHGYTPSSNFIKDVADRHR